MKHVVTTEWKKNLMFESKIDDHIIVIDAAREAGGDNQGPSPKKLMLTALAGCTGMDVVSILQKMRIDLTYFNIIIEAEVSEEHPKKYTKIHLIYQFKSDNPLDKEKLQKAIELSREKYCGVMAVYKQSIEITYEIQILS